MLSGRISAGIAARGLTGWARLGLAPVERKRDERLPVIT